MICFSLVVSNVATAQNCLDGKGQLDYKSLISQYQSDYKIVSQKNVKINSGEIVAIPYNFDSDFDYLIGLICSSSTQATGVELRDNLGNIVNYDINYSAFKNNLTMLQLSSGSRKSYKVVLNAIDKMNSNICGVFFIMAKEKEEQKGRRRNTSY